MSYIDQNLMANEQVIYKAKLHWIVFITPIILFVLGLLFISASGAFGGILILVALINLAIAFLNFTTSEFGITNKRVIIKVGIIKRNSLDTVLKKIESITVNQSIFGRILGYGSIIVSGSGGTPQPFSKIADPLEFRKKVNEQIEKAG